MIDRKCLYQDGRKFVINGRWHYPKFVIRHSYLLQMGKGAGRKKEPGAEGYPILLCTPQPSFPPELFEFVSGTRQKMREGPLLHDNSRCDSIGLRCCRTKNFLLWHGKHLETAAVACAHECLSRGKPIRLKFKQNIINIKSEYQIWSGNFPDKSDPPATTLN